MSNGNAISNGSTSTSANTEEDLLTSIEKKLRNPFTSLDLSRTVDTHPEPLHYLRSIQDSVFGERSGAVDKILKLQVLISLMGLDRGRRINDDEVRQQRRRRAKRHDADFVGDLELTELTPAEVDVVWSMLQTSQDGAVQKEEWVRVVAGLVQGRMYCRRPQTDTAKDHDDHDENDDEKVPSCQEAERSIGTEAQKMLRKANDKILKEVLKTLDKRQQQHSTTTNTEQDAIPFYGPMKYQALDPPLLRQTLPQLYYDQDTAKAEALAQQQCHFRIDPEAELLQYDHLQEVGRAQEEEREMEQTRILNEKKKQQMQGRGRMPGGGANRPNPTSTGPAGRSTSPAGRRPLPGSTSTSSSTTTAAAARQRLSTIPNKKTAASLRTGLGRGRIMGDSNKFMVRSNTIRSGVVGRQSRSATVGARLGTSSTSCGLRVLGSSSRQAKHSSAAAARGSGRGRMMGMDMDDVHSRLKRDEAGGGSAGASRGFGAGLGQDSRALRKRKLMEEARANGLVGGAAGAGAAAKRGRGGGFASRGGGAAAAAAARRTPAPTESVEEDHHEEHEEEEEAETHSHSQEDAEAEEEEEEEEEHTAPKPAQPADDGESFMNFGGGDDDDDDEDDEDDQHSNNQPPPPASTTHENWESLLEQSNKITPEDRVRVERFFTEQYNPTPEQLVYKIKLHEEKKVQPGGSTVKETLYLELDYQTFGFKKLRKIKKK